MTTTDESPEPTLKAHQPRFRQDAFHCPRCGSFAHQLWNRQGISETKIAEGPTTYSVGMWWEAVCQRCNRPSVWRDKQMVYPLAKLGEQPHEDMPPEVRELYVEAASVAAVSRRAGAALARATVERLIKMLDPEASKRATLDKRIERLKPKVSTPLGEMLDVVRVTGNGALHVDDDPAELVVMALSDEDGPQLLELLLETANDLVDELITKPKTTGDLWATLPEGIRKKLRPAEPGSGASPTSGAEDTR